MARKALFLATIVLVLAGLGAWHLRFQPAGQARVQRQGEKLDWTTARLGWAPRYRGSSCLVPRQGELLIYAGEVRPVGRTGESYPLQLEFSYLPPPQLATDWPAGDWCYSLPARLGQMATDWLREVGPDGVRRGDRDRAVGQALEGALRVAGFARLELAATFEMPAGMVEPAAIEQVAKQRRPQPPVFLIGLDGGDWQLLDRYITEGLMPNLAGLVAGGRRGVLLSEHPPLSPLLWTTLVTGVSPLEHRILDFTRFRPGDGLKEPITSDERQMPALWNMATQAGLESAVFGLWATYPAEPIKGLLVSDRLITFLYQEQDPPPGVVFPSRREEWARAVLRQVERTVDFDQVQTFLPWLDRAEYDRQAKPEGDPYAHPVGALRRILVETQVYHRLAVEQLAAGETDLAIVYLQGSDTIGHVFAPFAPPRQVTISAQDFRRYSEVPRRFFAYLDGLLGEYRDLAAQQGAVLMLASDHGFRWSEGRPTELSSSAVATAARWHRQQGIYLLWGPGIESGEGPQGGLRQVCATVVELLGLAPGEGLAGPLLAGLQPTGAALDYGVGFTPRKAASLPAANLAAAAEELAKLRSLGYLGGSEPTQAPAAAAASGRTAGSWNNQGLILKAEGQQVAAVAAFESALTVNPRLASALWNLSDLLFARDEDLERSDRLLARAYGQGLPQGLKYLIGRAIGYQRQGRVQRSLALLEDALSMRADEPDLWLFRGRYRIEGGDCDGASQDFERALQLDPDRPQSLASAAMASLCLGDAQAAQGMLQRSLELDPEQPAVRQMLRQMAEGAAR